jgi:hypothetical protein
MRARTHVGHDVKCPLLSFYFIQQRVIFLAKLRKVSFHQNRFGDSLVAISRQTDGHTYISWTQRLHFSQNFIATLLKMSQAHVAKWITLLFSNDVTQIPQRLHSPFTDTRQGRFNFIS